MSFTARAEKALIVTPAEKLSPPVRLVTTPPVDHGWLLEYEKQPDSIFNYYSVENEIDFLKKTATLPQEEREFYIEENVKRFLGEFVGKIPYTSIPYMLHSDGINYGGMHVLDSYTQAAVHGGSREKAETAGFARIEEEYLAKVREGQHPPAAVWISPPKTADYGFVFAMQPEENGHIKEYVIRYDEKQEERVQSDRILQHVDPSLRFTSTDEFLRTPVFMDARRFREQFPDLLRTIGIRDEEIARSGAFEQKVAGNLADWIHAYTETVLTASREASPSPQRIDEAKATLLAIYSYAERLKNIPERSPHHDDRNIPRDIPAVLSTDELAAAYLAMQSHAPTAQAGGSCPVVRKQDGLPGDQPSFISNSDMIRTLANGETLEDLSRKKTFPCPKCGFAIPSGEGKTSCPHCGITKEQYAKEQSVQMCD